jgi:hypothetical protein
MNGMKLSMIVALFLMSMCTASAQVKWGVEVGANASKFVGSGSMPSDKGSMKAGYQLGISADYSLGKHFSLLSGIGWSRQNNEAKLGLNYAGGNQMKYPKVEANLNYLRVPLALGYAFHISDKISVMPHVGVYAAYGFGAGDCDLSIRDDNSEEVKNQSWKPMDGLQSAGLSAFRKWDWGGLVGVKALLADHYYISIGYLQGVKKSYPQYDFRNSSFSFSLGYRF